MEMLAQTRDQDPEKSGRILRVMIEASRAIGSQGVVEGQYREVLSSGHVEEVGKTSEKMEGEIYACSAACGAMLGGGGEDEIDKLRSYGLNVGKIVGFLQRRDGEEDNVETMKRVEETKDLAIKELRFFKGDKVEAMYSLIDACVGLNHVYI
ncbi:PREDICTED: heterodimeric geranylgeranyl pyrophosphate synthase small subunit, chloroplastic-like [Tarenaya hassleriana]|uniref:heterodimeric geranylgeranyl pyrophosphate synthase small subunit, chloroplastic-like n=1 Tax=Tarenaya hassleriana TaxID=28532 RepID=UPI00053C9EAF|nr:PREDICTED: heterodimeric geranylgeranyl pyrophosphate synthase small subunit, chloroplastic-like [Tarenaya hassleriana]